MNLFLLSALVTLEGPVSKVDTTTMPMGSQASMVKIQVANDERWVLLGPIQWMEKGKIEVGVGDTVKVEAAENPMGLLMAISLKKKVGDEWVEWGLRDETGRPKWAGGGMQMPNPKIPKFGR